MTTKTTKTWSTQPKGKHGETRAKILRLIKSSWPVTRTQITDACGIARTGVERHLGILEREGAVRRYQSEGKRLSYYVPANVQSSAKDELPPEKTGKRQKAYAEPVAPVSSPTVPPGVVVPLTNDDERRWWLEGWRQGVLETLRELREKSS